ncbi:MAG: SDR family oxidoreductase [Rhodocyclales bacterium]|nr:SDR family oxidoreductase [Rhodocyclales bacterium]
MTGGRVLVTGATGGIGSQVCRLLSASGYTPLVGYRSAKIQEASKLASECGGVPVLLDMLDSFSIEKALAELAADDRPLVGAVIGASPPPMIGPFSRINGAQMDLFWKTNVEGPRQLLAGLVKGFFRRQKQGSIVFVLTSAMGTTARAAMPQMGAYLISKFGLMGVAEVIKAEYPWLNIQSVSPGFTETPMLDAFDPRFLDTIREKAPFDTPQTVAREVVEKISRNDSL